MEQARVPFFPLPGARLSLFTQLARENHLNTANYSENARAILRVTKQLFVTIESILLPIITPTRQTNTHPSTSKYA